MDSMRWWQAVIAAVLAVVANGDASPVLAQSVSGYLDTLVSSARERNPGLLVHESQSTALERVAFAIAPPASVRDESEDLDSLVATAIERNPQLQAIEAQTTALEHKVTRAGAWNDPKLTVSYQNVPLDSFALGDEPMSMLLLRLEQTVPFFGKTERRKGVVREDVKAKRWALEEGRNQLRALVKKAYYRLGLARQLKVLTQEHVALVEQLIDAVRIKYEVGRAGQQDLLRLEVLRDRLEDDLDDFDRDDREISVALNAALHRGIDTPVPTPAAFSVPDSAQPPSELLELARAHRPALKQLMATAARFRAASELALFEAVPDPTLFAGYGLRDDLPGGNPGKDLATVGFSVRLPLFYKSRYAAEAAQASSNERAAREQAAALDDAIASGLGESLAILERAARKAVTYEKELVFRAHRTLDATLSSYRVDRADFASLYDAQLELLNFEKTIRIATVEALLAQATLESLVGKELS